MDSAGDGSLMAAAVILIELAVAFLKGAGGFSLGVLSGLAVKRLINLLR